MKILAPIRAYDELEMLLESGAEELYCGIVPSEWSDRFNGPVWLNRRSPKGSGVETWEELRRLVDGAHAKQVPVFLTLNGPYYAADQMPLVIELATRLSEEAGVDALIVTDINLLARLSDAKLNAALHVSSVAATLNVDAIRFLLDFGPSRVILPRSVTLGEIDSIVQAVGRDVEIEVFVLNDGCAFEEGFCATTHHHSVGAFCTALSGMDTQFEWNGPRFTARRENWLRRNLADYRDWVWYVNGNGCGATPKGLPYGPCGLCAIPDLQRIGVASLKIVGREASPFKKLASVRMVRDIVNRTRAGDQKLTVIERAISLRGEPEHCHSGYMCYYKVDA
ncbi:MAG TPA: U32 family peptidase [Bryobacteraceae bacterium]|jgi:putative protease|nr:U32 family peptidase [Bryobacteraceae bacterium]